MLRMRSAAANIYIRLAWLLPGEFSRRYGVEMRLDFSDQLDVCATRSEVVCVAGRAYADLVTSAVREWQRSDLLKTLVYAGAVHTAIWLAVVAVAAWQWPGGSRVLPAVLMFAVASVPGIAMTVLRQRIDRSIPSGCCSRPPAELD